MMDCLTSLKISSLPDPPQDQGALVATLLIFVFRRKEQPCYLQLCLSHRCPSQCRYRPAGLSYIATKADILFRLVKPQQPLSLCPDSCSFGVRRLAQIIGFMDSIISAQRVLPGNPQANSWNQTPLLITGSVSCDSLFPAGESSAAMVSWQPLSRPFPQTLHLRKILPARDVLRGPGGS